MMINHAVEMLKGYGIKITPQRRGIIEVMTRVRKPLTIQEILQRVRKKFPDISHDTVYRTVDLLVRFQVVVPLHLTDGEVNRYELQDPTNPHHHLVCLGCGVSFCLESCPVNHQQIPEAKELDFTIKRHALEFYGYCKKCNTQ